MEKEDITLSDIKRILIGNAPPEFLLEVLIRTVIVYVSLLVIVKLLGKRMCGQITLLEMAVMITLGAIVGSPAQLPDRGILVGVALLLYILFFQRLISNWSFRSPALERLVQGKITVLVNDGVIDLDVMKGVRITQQQLFALLREQQVTQLGIASRVYLETTGVISVFKSDSPRPGLSTLPPDDKSMKKQQRVAKDKSACHRCGFVADVPEAPCPRCNENKWLPAIY